MKAAVLTGLNQIDIRDVPDPVIVNDTDVLVKIRAVGVCGSDIHYYRSGGIGGQVVQYPFVVGHECAGVVEETGPNVTRVQKGDRVAIDPAMSCGECDQCKKGRAHTCRQLLFLGCPGQLEGALSEYIVIPEKSLFPVQETMTMDQAVLTEPLSIGIYSVAQALPMKGTCIGILGSGPIGLSVLLAAREQGAQKIFVTDKIDSRLIASDKAGATWTGNTDKEDIVKKITGQNPLLLDAVFECCGQQHALDQAVKLLKPGGKLVIVGIPQVSRVCFDIEDLRRKEICIINIRRQLNCTGHAIEMIQNSILNLDFLVTHHFPLDKTKEAFDLVAGYEDGVIKAIIDF